MVGRKILFAYNATHWAVKVGNTWYEVPGASKGDKNKKNEIMRGYGQAAPSGALPLGGGLVGSTTKSQAEIDEFIQKWEHDNPYYDLYSTNCQKFAKDFVDFLCGSYAKFPVAMEAGMRKHVHGPMGFAVAANGTAVAEATTGRAEGQYGIAHATAEGCNAGAMALCGEEGFGAFSKASVGRAEAGIGAVGVHLDLNVNTGVGFRNGNVEASVLGFGFKAGGGHGIELDTPIGGAKCNIM